MLHLATQDHYSRTLHYIAINECMSFYDITPVTRSLTPAVHGHDWTGDDISIVTAETSNWQCCKHRIEDVFRGFGILQSSGIGSSEYSGCIDMICYMNDRIYSIYRHPS